MKPNKLIYVFLFFLLIINITVAQKKVSQKELRSKFVLENNSKKYYGNIIQFINETFEKKLNSSTSANWKKAIQEAESLFLNNKKITDAVNKALLLKTDKFIKLQRTALEFAYGNKNKIFNKAIENIFNNTKDKISFAIALHYLFETDRKKYSRDYLVNFLILKFKDYKSNPLLKSLHYYFTHPTKEIFNEQPPLKDLFTHQFQKGKTIIYTVLRKNRNYAGITIIKKPDGNFVKNKNGSIFSIPQLAASFSNLPAYIPNGNTPTGIYSIVGTYITPKESIGPTPNILIRTPFEVSPKVFFHSRNKHKKWNKEDYKNLLPKSWQNYFPVYQSYYAGKTGRKLIIMHGSTDDLNYYKNLPYYPLSPTQGCLSSKEIWDSKTGKCLESDQVKLINAFRSTKQTKGFLVVVEIDDKDKDVTLDELKTFLPD